MAEPLSVGLHACEQVEARPGKTVLILGAGPIGLMTLAAAKAFGVTDIIVCDIQKNRIKIAEEIGASHVFDSSEKDPVEVINSLTNNRGVDCCIETAGNTITHNLTVPLTRKGGNIALVGIPREPEAPMNVFDIIDKELTIRGVFRYANTYKTAVDILACGIVDFESLITQRFPLSETGRALETTLSEKNTSIKNVIVN
jgi:L-iditol 2-dehydrogenase